MFGPLLSALSFLTPRYDDDFIDRLSYYYTSTFLIICGILVGFKQFAGRPLTCWVDASYTKNWEDYTEMYCWAQNTYYVSMTETEVPADETRYSQEISYYQWVPFWFWFQAFCFYLPCAFWRVSSEDSGFKVNEVIKVACDAKNLDPTERRKTTVLLARNFHAVVCHQWKANRRKVLLHSWYCRCCSLRYKSYYLTIMYLTSKFLYFSNLIIQLFIINKVLNADGVSNYGLDTIVSLLSGNGWKESGNFPRVTHCDFDVRVLSNVQRHTVQCLLVINIFTEKIFIILWLLFIILVILYTLNFVHWCILILSPQQKIRFVGRHLEAERHHFDSEGKKTRNQKLSDFINKYVRTDGIFVLRLIILHADVIIGTELMRRMYNLYQQYGLEDPECPAAHMGPTSSFVAVDMPDGCPHTSFGNGKVPARVDHFTRGVTVDLSQSDETHDAELNDHDQLLHTISEQSSN